MSIFREQDYQKENAPNPEDSLPHIIAATDCLYFQLCYSYSFFLKVNISLR